MLTVWGPFRPERRVARGPSLVSMLPEVRSSSSLATLLVREQVAIRLGEDQPRSLSALTRFALQWLSVVSQRDLGIYFT